MVSSPGVPWKQADQRITPGRIIVRRQEIVVRQPQSRAVRQVARDIGACGRHHPKPGRFTGHRAGHVRHHHGVVAFIGRLDGAEGEGVSRLARKLMTVQPPLIRERRCAGSRYRKRSVRAYVNRLVLERDRGCDARWGGRQEDRQVRHVAGDGAVSVGDHHAVVARVAGLDVGQDQAALVRSARSVQSVLSFCHW